MKKIFSLILTMILAVSMVVCAHADDDTWYCTTCQETRDTPFCPVCGAGQPSSGDWPSMHFSGTETSLKSNENEYFRYASSFGPDASYPDAGAYKPYKVTKAMALFREGDYVYVDMDYRTVGKRCLYFRDYALTDADVEQITLESYPAHTTTEVQPRFGPGTEYDGVIQTVEDYEMGLVQTHKVKIKAGTSVRAFFEMNDWVFAEFDSALGVIRAWIPADLISE